MKDNTINNYFENSTNDFLKGFSKYQNQTQVITKTWLFGDTDILEIQTPGECWQWSIVAGAFFDVNVPPPVFDALLLKVFVNEVPTLVKINPLSFPFAPTFAQIFSGVPYIQKSDLIRIEPPAFLTSPDELRVNIIFDVLLPKY